MKRQSIGILAILLFGFFNLAAQDSLLAVQNSFKEEQKILVGALSGATKIDADHQLKGRWTVEERALTRTYLSKWIDQIGLKAEEQPYNMPNLNPLLDILIDPYEGTNLYTIVPATVSSDEYIILGAHYDTDRDCPGANDNASAVALIASVAKRINTLKFRTKNLLIVFFDQEEEELVGSKAFVRFLKSKPFNINTVLTVDQMGWDMDGDRNVELELPTPQLEALFKKMAIPLGITVYSTKVDATDHYSFREAGYVAAGLTEEFVHQDTSPYKDTPKDTYDTLNFEYLASSTYLVYTVMEALVTK